MRMRDIELGVVDVLHAGTAQYPERARFQPNVTEEVVGPA
jgi:hypothetical protein